LIDIGANLTHESFARDRNAVLDRAVAAGVEAIVLTGTSEVGSRDALTLARTRPRLLYSTAGVHPHDARSCTASTIPKLRALLVQPEVVAVGECGLDFNRDYSPRPDQERAFAAQLALAAEVHKPLFLHERDAHERFLDLVTPMRDAIGDAVLHCFTGSAAELDAYLELNLHIGITGWICDERRGQHLQELVSRIPLDRLLVETDAPYLVPRDIRPRPRRNEPAFLPHVIQTLARCLQRSVEEVAHATAENARRFFGIATETE
jgi:TatD DNase family protein